MLYAIADKIIDDYLEVVAAADLQEETGKPVGDVLSLAPRSVSPDPTKTAATNEHRSEPSEQ